MEIPIPPSVNHLWRAYRAAGKVRVRLDSKYKAWREEAALLLRVGLPRPKVFPTGVQVTIVGGVGWRKGRDLDNCLKPVLDAMVLAGVIPEDSWEVVNWVQVRYLAARSDEPARCRVVLVPGGGPC